jgi:hypothetical protein
LVDASAIDRLTGLASPICLDQIIRARQAADMAGQDMIAAGSHALPLR